MPSKYRITKTVTTESSLRTRIEIVEGEDGSYAGHVTLVDERGDVVERQPLAPEDLDQIVGLVTSSKTKVLEDAGAVLVPEGEAVEPVEQPAPNKSKEKTK